MPPLSPEITAKISQDLRKSRDDLLATVRSRTDAAADERPSIGPGAHFAQNDDWPVAEMISHNEEHLAEHESNLLQEIDTALGRLEAGGYGICVSCGREIPEARLLATPTVQTCIACQDRIEKEQHTGRGPTM
jgi:RNA polymerase-binding protein DksA